MTISLQSKSLYHYLCVMYSRRGKHRVFSLSSTLLLLSFLFSIAYPSFHSVLHFETQNELERHCSIEYEEDHCHQFIYHYKRDISCAHKEHILEYFDHCDLCASLITYPLIKYVKTEIRIAHSEMNIDVLFEKNGLLSFYFFNEEVRGPPLTVC